MTVHQPLPVFLDKQTSSEPVVRIAIERRISALEHRTDSRGRTVHFIRPRMMLTVIDRFPTC
jgi:hypothetical protein